MNNKEFVQVLSDSLNVSPDTVENGISVLSKAFVELLDDDTSLAVKGFGTFEVKKRIERVAVNPATQQKMLIPPKLTLSFRPSPMLKDRVATDDDSAN